MACTYETYYNPLDSQKHCTLSHVNFAWWWIHPLQPPLLFGKFKNSWGTWRDTTCFGPCLVQKHTQTVEFLCITGEMCVDLVAGHVHENFKATRFWWSSGPKNGLKLTCNEYECSFGRGSCTCTQSWIDWSLLKCFFVRSFVCRYEKQFRVIKWRSIKAHEYGDCQSLLC